MGISIPLNDIAYSSFYRYEYITHTETKERMLIIRDFHGNFAHYYGCEPNKLVLYKSLHDDTGIYARPIEMFASEIDKEKYPNVVDQQFRFELVRY